MTSYAIDNLAYIPSPSGQFEFETDDYLEMVRRLLSRVPSGMSRLVRRDVQDDTWSNSCVDSVKQLVFFQVAAAPAVHKLEHEPS